LYLLIISKCLCPYNIDVQYLSLMYTLYCTYSTLRDGLEVRLEDRLLWIIAFCILYYYAPYARREWTRMRWERRPRLCLETDLSKVSREKLRLRFSNIVLCRVAVNKIIYTNTSFIQTLYYFILFQKYLEGGMCNRIDDCFGIGYSNIKCIIRMFV
jgi:hypothetical protein